MHQLNEIKQILVESALEERKEFSKKIIPTNQKVYGVPMPVINDLAKKYKESGIPLAEKLWRNGSLEEQLLAAKLMGKVAKKNPERILELVYEFSSDIKDWAVCDTLGMQAVKPIADKFKNEIWHLSDELISSKKLWQRRIALVLIEYYTRYPEMHPRIRKQIEKVANDSEYYVKKAIQWLERNMKKG